MSTLSPLAISSWVRARAAVVDTAQQLYVEVPKEKDPVKALEVLSLLVSDRRMQRVWDVLYQKKRINHKPTAQFRYPAYITNASNAARLRRLACELRKEGGKKTIAMSNSWKRKRLYLNALEIHPLIQGGANKIAPCNFSCVTLIATFSTLNRCFFQT